jgi:hypothetical protein
MSGFAIVLMVIAMAVTVIVLFTGLFSMARGGEFDRKYSNKLMRLRILAQAIALILFAIAMATKNG